jgi:hypothetical protein
MPIEISVDSKHKLLWNTASFYGLNTQDFMLSSFKQITSFLKGIHDG